jgi:hypothetical protein
MKNLLLIMSSLFLFSSCEKEVKLNLPETKSLPVMYSYICPSDSLISLKLLYSSPLYSSNEIDIMASVPDGDVRISSTQGTAQLIFNQVSGYYELPTTAYPLIPGQTYRMTVVTSKGEVAMAETQVPYATIPINKVSVQTIPEAYQTSDRIEASFTDEPGTVNYYRLAALHLYAYSGTNMLEEDTRISALYTDINHDGEEAFLAERYYKISGGIYYSSEAYDVFLYNCSQSYYNFYKSLNNYSGNNPFSEPSLIYSNVTGGLGCFGAYTKSVLRSK